MMIILIFYKKVGFMIFDDICVFELDVTLLFFREILNIFRCFSEY